MFGFLNVYKPVGMTSHDVVSVLRRITKIKQIGHTGTLDPFAEGVLPICIGKSTRLIEYLEDDKAYIGTFCFGKSTDTYDVEGKVLASFEEKVLQDDIINSLKVFEGEIEQIPPIYSAIKVKGKKLYDYAREGKEVEIKPRKVFIEKIELLNFDYELQVAEIYIKCSKGTYIRSIGHDLGENLNNGCYLSKLKRVQAGKFLIENSVALESLKVIEDVQSNLINPVDYLNLERQELNEVEYNRTLHGMGIYNRVGAVEKEVVLTKNGVLVGIAKPTENGLKISKVFVSEN
jgi:tRNA pseudouridine55 synthase